MPISILAVLVAIFVSFSCCQNDSEASSCTSFHVGNKSEVASQYHHHNNISAFWNDLLKPRFALGPAYPINYEANTSDFSPIFDSLIRKNITSAFDERWPLEFLPTLNALISSANAAPITNASLASNLYLRNGYAHLIVEIPGTGASPALPRDPASPDRVWTSVLDWIATQPSLDSRKVVFWGVSTGGYYGMRVSPTRIAIASSAPSGNGGWSHCTLTGKKWMHIADAGEYPTSLSTNFCVKIPGTTLEARRTRFLDDLPRLKSRFSLVDSGVLEEADSAPLLLVNWIEDTIFQVEDSMVLLEFGRLKSARFVRGAHHPGEPAATPVIFRWTENLMASVSQCLCMVC
ncbi:hypothetical protein LTS18_008404 [Coniosporium uncinatum]|uniref:Uncharacterized protein n=1 Tax=Coniosporium uncinatum TaxID=93489 RepID=A0ACC3DA61_9PEZI|nr:hypothetical protein LTS18_008404 [Coniosporium uncinatum]